MHLSEPVHKGLFMMMTNGVGALLGSKVSGYVIDKYYTTAGGDKNWQGTGLAFAIYALVVAVFFAIFFRHKHNPKEVESVQH